MASFCSQDACDDCPGRFVCRCLQVTESQLIEVLNRLPVRTVKDIRQFTGAGDGCTACHSRLQQLIEECRQLQIAVAD